MEDLPLSARQEIDAAIPDALVGMTYELYSSDLPIDLHVAAETIQRLKLLYTSDPVAYREIVELCRRERREQPTTSIGPIDNVQAELIADVVEGLTEAEFMERPLQDLIMKAVSITLDA